jgi:hypothetical protein
MANVLTDYRPTKVAEINLPPELVQLPDGEADWDNPKFHFEIWVPCQTATGEGVASAPPSQQLVTWDWSMTLSEMAAFLGWDSVPKGTRVNVYLPYTFKYGDFEKRFIQCQSMTLRPMNRGFAGWRGVEPGPSRTIDLICTPMVFDMQAPTIQLVLTKNSPKRLVVERDNQGRVKAIVPRDF